MAEVANAELGSDERAGTGTPSEVVDYQHALISSRRVEGTAVFDREGHKLGTIHSVMLTKREGRVAYALLGFGGFLGLKEHVYPLPWELLTYDVDLEGYVVDLTRDQLRDAPALHLDDSDRPVDQRYEEAVSSYWGTMRWWGL